MDQDLIINYNDNDDVTIAGYKIDSSLLCSKESPIATINFKKNISEVKSFHELFEGKIVPAGLFSMAYAAQKKPKSDIMVINNDELLNNLNELTESPKKSKSSKSLKRRAPKNRKNKTKKNQ